MGIARPRFTTIGSAQGVYVGSPSWKYPGWLGLVYDKSRYLFRGKLAKSRFERGCLMEYAEVFKSVCVDATFYAPPTKPALEALAAQVPADFKFAFKVTDMFTVKRFPDVPRYRDRRGTQNADFLNAEKLANEFLGPCEAIRSKVGPLIFEFSPFGRADYQHSQEFLADLDAFLARLPTGWAYAVELRNESWLGQEYLRCLAGHGAAHVFNSWAEMPPVGEQLDLPGSPTNSELVAARLLLTPGRSYERSMQEFAPFDRIRDVDENVRAAAKVLIEEGIRRPS